MSLYFASQEEVIQTFSQVYSNPDEAHKQIQTFRDNDAYWLENNQGLSALGKRRLEELLP